MADYENGEGEEEVEYEEVEYEEGEEGEAEVEAEGESAEAAGEAEATPEPEAAPQIEPTSPTSGSSEGHSPTSPEPLSVPEEADPRLLKALTVVRTLPEAALNEQCVLTEWSALTTDVEKDILLEALQDQTFWREVREMANADIGIVPDEESEVDSDSRLLQMFKVFDKDGSGRIDDGEIHQMLLYMGINATQDECKELIKRYDVDGDNEIDPHEFLKIMESAQQGNLAVQLKNKTGAISEADIDAATAQADSEFD